MAQSPWVEIYQVKGNVVYKHAFLLIGSDEKLLLGLLAEMLRHRELHPSKTYLPFIPTARLEVCLQVYHWKALSSLNASTQTRNYTAAKSRLETYWMEQFLHLQQQIYFIGHLNSSLAIEEAEALGIWIISVALTDQMAATAVQIAIMMATVTLIIDMMTHQAAEDQTTLATTLWIRPIALYHSAAQLFII